MARVVDSAVDEIERTLLHAGVRHAQAETHATIDETMAAIDHAARAA